MHGPARAVINVGAIRRNTAALAARTDADIIAVVKADGYGHGAAQAAQAAVEGGANRIGIAQVAEAVNVLEAGGLPDVPLFAWMFAPSTDLRPAVDAGIELSAGGTWALKTIAAAARATGKRARVHLALNTGMAREGAEPGEWEELVRIALSLPDIDVMGAWSHLARADEPVATTRQQTEMFTEKVESARALGADFEIIHLAASGGMLFHPDTHFNAIRLGIAMYGLMPDGSDPARYGLEPAMQLEAELIAVRTVPEHTPVSYGGTASVGPTRLATIPLGYGDGIPRQASYADPIEPAAEPAAASSAPRAWVSVNGHKAPVVGRICMDQFMVDLGRDSDAAPGDTAILWGAGDGLPTVETWARAAGTINYTMVTGLGPRVARTWVDQ